MISQLAISKRNLIPDTPFNNVGYSTISCFKCCPHKQVFVDMETATHLNICLAFVLHMIGNIKSELCNKRKPLNPQIMGYVPTQVT